MRKSFWHHAIYKHSLHKLIASTCMLVPCLVFSQSLCALRSCKLYISILVTAALTLVSHMVSQLWRYTGMGWTRSRRSSWTAFRLSHSAPSGLRTTSTTGSRPNRWARTGITPTTARRGLTACTEPSLCDHDLDQKNVLVSSAVRLSRVPINWNVSTCSIRLQSIIQHHV